MFRITETLQSKRCREHDDHQVRYSTSSTDDGMPSVRWMSCVWAIPDSALLCVVFGSERIVVPRPSYLYNYQLSSGCRTDALYLLEEEEEEEKILL
jgi:hypothetical protein